MSGLRHWCSASPRAIPLFVLLNVILLSFFISLYSSSSGSSNWLIDSRHFRKPWAQSTETASPIEAIRSTEVATTIFVTTTVAATATTTREIVATSTVTLKPTIPGPAFCDACGPDDTLCVKYGKHNLAKSRLYEGTNFRFHRVIKQALAGEVVKIGVLGGSVTKGHGLRSTSDNWTQRFLEAWETLFPNSPTELVNGAVPATGSDYLSVCFGEHIEPDVDLVLIELAINDQRIESNAHAHEWLIRGILDMPKRPAVINIQTMALLFETISMGGDLHIPIAQYYDTPILSIRNFLLPHILNHADLDEHYFTKNKDGPDWRHVDLNGHAVMADILIAYTQRQLCAVKLDESQPRSHELDSKLPTQEDLDEIPRIRLLQKYDRQTVLGHFTPFCRTVRTNRHPLTPVETKGWSLWTYQGRGDKPYLIAYNPGDYAKFEIDVGMLGRVRVTYLRSKVFGLGNVWCWLDDDRKNGKKIVGWWDKENLNIARVEVITEKADPGKHMLTCEVLQDTSDPEKGHEFRLIAVDAS